MTFTTTTIQLMGEPTPPQDQRESDNSVLVTAPQGLIKKVSGEGDNTGASEAAKERLGQIMSAKDQVAEKIASEVPIWYELDFTHGGRKRGLSIDPVTFRETDDTVKSEIHRRAFYKGLDGQKVPVNLTTSVHVGSDGVERSVDEVDFGDPISSAREDFVVVDDERVALYHTWLMAPPDVIQAARLQDGDLKVVSRPRMPIGRENADVLDSAARGLGFFLDSATNLTAVTQYERDNEGRITRIKEVDATELPSLTPPAQPAPSV